VLYFESLSRDTSDAYIADGLTEEITSRLGQVGRLVVTSRTSVRRMRATAATMSPSELGRALNVSYLVNGTVRRVGPRLRVTVELLRASTGVQSWSSQYDRTTEDLLGIQDEIAVAVAAGITGQLLPAERARLQARPTTNPAAYDLYLRGSHAFTRVSGEGLQEAIASFEAALRLDPGFTGARARMAYAYGFAVNWDFPIAGVPSDSLIARGQVAADRALREDSSSADAWTGRGWLEFFRDPPDYRAALAALQRAVLLDSGNGLAHNNYGTVLRRLGDYDAAEPEIRRSASEPGPFQVQSTADIGFVNFSRRRYREALVWYDSAMAINGALSTNLAFRARVRLALGDTSGAVADADAAIRLGSASTRIRLLATKAYFDAVTGDVAGARSRLETVIASLAPPGQLVSVRVGWEIASALVAIGDTDRAVGMIERVRPRGAWLWSYLVFPDFDPIRADPRFQRIYAEARPVGAPLLPFER
jgi:TolB-like protein/Tfp pilus assembly protein PilF